MSGTIPAITIWQPWASLIAAEVKPFEFRGWAPPRSFWHLRVAIHAGARPVRRGEVAELTAKLQGDHWRVTGLSDRSSALAVLEAWWRNHQALPLSSVLCTATLGAPLRNDALADALGLPRLNDSDRDEHSNYGWPLTDIRRLQPFVPARGAQGFWRWMPPSKED